MRCLLAAAALCLPPHSLAETKPLVFAHVTVIDATGSPARPDQTVIVTGERLSTMGPTGKVDIPEGAEVVDAAGKFMIPGLWDMHVHWYERDLLSLFVANGVTGVRQMWGMPIHLQWRKEFGEGKLLGPRMLLAGPIVDGPTPIWKGSMAISTPEEGKKAVATIKAQGYDFIKVYQLLARETYFAIADEAKQLGIPFSGHVPSRVTALEASAAGQRSMEHLFGVHLACSPDEAALMKEYVATLDPPGAYDWPLFARFRVKAGDKYDEKKAAALFAGFVKNGTWQVPTLTVLRAMCSLNDSAFTNDARLKYVPPSIRAMWNPKEDFRLRKMTPADFAGQKQLFQKELRLVSDMHKAGVRLLAGTDTPNPYCFPGFSLHDELELLVTKCRFTPMEALQTATRDAAEYIDRLKDLGTVEQGKLADLVLLDANPLDDIHNTTKINAVVMNGKLLPRATLQAMLDKAEAECKEKEQAPKNAEKDKPNSDQPAPKHAEAPPSKRIKPTAERLFFQCKLLINPATKETIPDAIIETNGGTILRVEKAKEFSLPGDAKVIDCRDKYVIPGLVDTHGHLYTRTHFTTKTWQKTNSLLPIFHLAAGVTTIGDPGSMDGVGDIALRNRIDSGELPGPRYFLAGEYIEMPSGLIGWMGPVKTPEEARSKVHMWAARGATAIKIYATAQGEVMQAAIDEAHEHSMKVWAHVGAVTFQQAIDMGVDQLFHGALVMPDTRRPGITQKEWKEFTKETANLDLTHPKVELMFRAAARRKVVLTPTAVVSEIAGPDRFQKHHLEEQQRFYAPAAWEEMLKLDKNPPSSFRPVEDWVGGLKKNKEFIRRAYDAGCLLSTGTDYVVLAMLPGWCLWREMEIFAEAGLPPMAILKAATWNGVYAIGRTDQLGSVEPGKLADFVILSANPLDNISNVRRVHRVVKGGVVYDPEELLKPLVGKVD